MKEKITKIAGSKYFIVSCVLFINWLFFIICNTLFELRYETLDDFMITNILSKADGTYNFYSIHIHPILSYLIMLLYKTEININFYTIVLLSIQFISFSIIGFILLKKNKIWGTISYVLIIMTIYSRVLLVINYTSTAGIAILAGIISIMNYFDNNIMRDKIIGLILISFGVMLRFQSVIIVLPFYIIYSIYHLIKNKDYKAIKLLGMIFLIILFLYISNYFIYKSNAIYKKYTEFNDIRTYFFDYAILDYNNNKEVFEKNGWTYEDWKVFYTYSFSDENFYTADNLNNLKLNMSENVKTITNKILYSLKTMYILTLNKYLILFLVITIILLISFILNKNRVLILICFLLHLLINCVLCYIKPMYRVIVPLYGTTLTIIIYLLLVEKKSYKHKKYYTILLIGVIIYMSIINNIYIYKENSVYTKDNYTIIRRIINYTNNNKENAYVYPNALGNISLAYSVYEKVPDNTFSNLRHMGDWDIYNKEYYEFKERYNLENIIPDLYKKDNLYIITGSVAGANNKIYHNHIDTLSDYIKQHYNINVRYKVIKEFTKTTKIYKLFVDQR